MHQSNRLICPPPQAFGLQSVRAASGDIDLCPSVALEGSQLCGGLNSTLPSSQLTVKSTTYSVTLVKHIIEANSAPVTTPVTGPASSLVTVDENSDGQRLDNFLMRQLKGVPKTHVYRIIRSGEVRINKGRVQADTRVQTGDVVRVPPVRVSDKIAEKLDNPAPAREFPILLEDDQLIALDKPAGVAVHGGSGVSFGVIEQLRRARPHSKFLELVHRLDRDTSGILLVAKKRSALTKLQDQFRERETGKTYLALVVGQWPANKKVLDKPLVKFLLPTKVGMDGQDGERRVKVTSKDDPEGMKSVTLVKVAQKGEKFTLLEVTIKTGRTHQIRVHLASEGFPIAGDDKYGDFDVNKALQKHGLKRMFLHAWRLQFNHPATEERVELLAELPSELRQISLLYNK
jgi:23S rRNA pseudouridine955/2504/2580 synthase